MSDSANFDAPTSEQNGIPLAERLILALDVPTVEEAYDIVRRVTPTVSFFKIGMQLQFSGGLNLAENLIAEGNKVFLDSKLLDISNTITNSVRNIAKMNVSFLTIHGERKAIKAAVEGAQGTDLKILAITFLTNLVKEDLEDLGIKEDVVPYSERRARIAREAGAHGLIGSGAEAHYLREIVEDDLFIACPGIRMIEDAPGDQARIADPYTAMRNGADYIVVGRPILTADDPAEKAKNYFAEIARGLEARQAEHQLASVAAE